MSRLFAFLCALLFVGSAAATDWPQVRFDDNRTGYNSVETTIGPSNVGSLQIAWSQDLGTQGASGIVIANGIVYLQKNNGPLVAYSASGCGSAKCSSQLWQTPAGLHFMYGMAVADGVIYASGYRETQAGTSVLYAFAAGGCGASVCSPLWHSAVKSDMGSVAVVNGRVYSGSGSGNVYVFDAAGCPSGACQPLWTGKTGFFNLAGPVTVVDGKVYASSRPWLYVFDAAGCGSSVCQPLWTGPSRGATPSVVDGSVFMQFNYAPLVAFDSNGCGASRCNPLWEAVPDSGYFAGQAVAEGIVYVRYSNVGIRAFAAAGCGEATCNPLWTLGAPPGNAGLIGLPTVANGLVFDVVNVVPTSGIPQLQLLAWPAQPCGQDLCEPIWTSRAGETVVGEPVIVDGRLYALFVSGQRYSLDVYTLP